MNTLRFYLLALIALVSSYACKTTQGVVDTTEEEPIVIPVEEVITEERLLDELQITAPRDFVLPRYNPEATRLFDLIHTSLDIRFDWTNEHVIGRADLTLRPFFYPRQILELDAKGFDILSVTSFNGRELSHEYDGKKLHIDMGRLYTRDEDIRVTIDYIAKPSEGPVGGSAAITSDKGLFFINPRNEEPNKPQQIWTQGETEHNSNWFPTIDKPNERCTQEIKLTVQNRFKTLSNGTLISSTPLGPDKRVDHWKMDDPHAPYLFMIAVGEFARVTEEWNGKLLEYYVEEEYEPYAKDIYAHTPEMLTFFSDILDYPYPWDKYSQIITRDYVSGAMENTTAVIFGDFIQKTDRELIDNDNDYIVAHEMVHHWFGDLVTCESWANLTLNEAFANYSEYLWEEYKYGADDAGYLRMNERSGYLNSIQQSGIHPLIHYGYNDKEEMFDGHTYNKGGLILHMLRHYMGDEAFYASLNHYLTKNAYSAVESDELRMAFEDIFGEDLNWFFDQWFLSAGHPQLEISHSYDTVAAEVIIEIAQTQDPEQSAPIFQLPVTISVYDEEGQESMFDVWINKRTQEIHLPFHRDPALVVFDKEDLLLYTKQEDKTTQEYINQYSWAKTFKHRYEAIDRIKSKSDAQETLQAALYDRHFSIRQKAVEYIQIKDDRLIVERLADMAKNDPHSSVRGAAIKKLSSDQTIDVTALLDGVFETERAYPVIATALESLASIDQDLAIEKAKALQDEPTTQLVGGIAEVLSMSGDSMYLPYFEQRLNSVSLYQVFNFYESYFELLKDQPQQIIERSNARLKEIALNPSENLFYKFLATNTLSRLSYYYSEASPDFAKKIEMDIQEIKDNETNEILVQRYSSF